MLSLVWKDLVAKYMRNYRIRNRRYYDEIYYSMLYNKGGILHYEASN
ncbi:hypothetical protein [Brachyspira hyodysenteriae]|nr:hypothetical protein [Brachyspira hyodysenteriae]MCZ9896265.1 hypothetical protein [Brachyspira hyodysenteriae]